MNSDKKRIALLLAFFLGATSFLTMPSAHALSTSSSTLQLDIDKTGASVNGQQIELEVPATIIADKMYVPAKFLGDAMDFPVEWDNASRMIRMSPPGYVLTLDSDHRKVYINGVEVPFDSVAAIVKGKLLVKLTWVTDYMGASYSYDDALRRVTILYTPHPESIYVHADGNSSPVAKFATAKLTYRIGEPVKYVDLSYDPDAEGVAYQWTGRQDAFFAAGQYPVSLKVSDQYGHTSKLFSSYVTVTDEPYLSRDEYPFYTTPVGGFIQTNWGLPWAQFGELSALTKTVAPSPGRKLLVSSSPEEITEQGVLYQDQVNGKARLYASHMNGTQQKMAMAIFATNKTNKPVSIRTTKKSALVLAGYENMVGDQTATDMLLGKEYDDKLIVPPNRTLVYTQIPNIFPGDVVNFFSDMETDGEVEMTFVTAEEITQSLVNGAFLQPVKGNTRGTFPFAEQTWNVQASKLDKVYTVTFGDNNRDPYVKGMDATVKQETVNAGNLGVVYKVHADKPRKMAIMVLARGGIFKGTIKVNGKIVKVPESGVMTMLDGMKVLAHTTGTEDALDIEFTPPVGSALPIDLIFYPLDDKK
jgi:PKD repeat protein